MKENEIKKASSESYVDPVVLAENVVGYTTGRWQKRPDSQKNRVVGQKDHFTCMTRQEKIRDKIKNYKHTHKKEQISK